MQIAAGVHRESARDRELGRCRWSTIATEARLAIARVYRNNAARCDAEYLVEIRVAHITVAGRVHGDGRRYDLDSVDGLATALELNQSIAGDGRDVVELGRRQRRQAEEGRGGEAAVS